MRDYAPLRGPLEHVRGAVGEGTKIISFITQPSTPPFDRDAKPASDDFLDEPIGMGTRREQGLGLRTKAGLAGAAEIEIRRAEGGRKPGALMEKRLQTRPQVVHPERSGWG